MFTEWGGRDHLVAPVTATGTEQRLATLSTSGSCQTTAKRNTSPIELKLKPPVNRDQINGLVWCQWMMNTADSEQAVHTTLDKFSVDRS
jgi:hypothetical protein